MKRIFKYKKLLLSIVALILIFMFAIGTTYGWIENIYHVEFNTDENGEDHPLTISENIDAEVEITNTNSTVQLGRLLDSTDEHVITNNGYFYESGDMHLSPCYGDGESFYFPTGDHDGTAADYRLGNHDDENVNYISMTVKVSSPTAKTEYWFEDFNVDLKDKNGNSVSNADDYIRFSVTSDGATSVFSNDGTYKSLASTSSSPAPKGGNVINNFRYDDSTNEHSYRKTYGNTLFAVPKGETKVVNFKIWLEKPSDSSISTVTVSDIDITLSSSWAKTRRITLEDKTTGAGANSWVGNNGARLYLCVPSLDPTGWYKANNNPSDGRKELTQTDDSGKKYIELPAVYNGEKMYIIRTNSTGFKNEADGNKTYQLGTRDTFLNGLSIYGWNYWETNMPDTFCDEVFTLYGGSYDTTAEKEYKDSNIADTSTKFGSATYLGYGTWSGVMEIRIYGKSGRTNNNDYSYNNSSDISKTHMFVEDYSDYFTAGKVYIYTMNYYENINNSCAWRVYVPKTSTKIEFHYRDTRINNDNRYWGYSTQTGETQTRSATFDNTGLSRPTGTDYNTYLYTGDFDNPGLGHGKWYTENQSSTTAATTASTDNMTGYNPKNSNYYLKNSSGDRFYFHEKNDDSTKFKAQVTFYSATTMWFNVFNENNPTNPTNKTKYGLAQALQFSPGANVNIETNTDQVNNFGIQVSSAGTYIIAMEVSDQMTQNNKSYYRIAKITSIIKSS